MMCALCTNRHQTWDCPQAKSTIAAYDHPFTYRQRLAEPAEPPVMLPAAPTYRTPPVNPLGGAVAVGCATVVQ